MFAKLRPYVSTEQVKDVNLIAQSGFGEVNVFLYTGTTPEMAAGLRHVGALLQVAGFVFFIACVNVDCEAPGVRPRNVSPP